MKLFYRKLGQGEPLIILHGLYGSSDNWLNIGKELAEHFTVYLIDQRNHGKSFHSNSHTYPDMREDLLDFLDAKNIEKANIIGHSMGGKTASFFAIKYPERVKRLIIVDILPTPYKIEDSSSPQVLSHKIIIESLQNLDIENIKTIKEADESLKNNIPYKRVRQFLLKNLKRDKDNKFYWLLNLKILEKDLPQIMDGIHLNSIKEKVDTFPVLFIKGGESEYINEKDIDKIKQIFPKANLTTIKGAGHWVHAEKREEFMSIVNQFLLN